MSFSPLFYVNSVFCMCVVCFLSFVDFNKICSPQKIRNDIVLSCILRRLSNSSALNCSLITHWEVMSMQISITEKYRLNSQSYTNTNVL